MGSVLGIGGVFFKTALPQVLSDWYRRVLGLEIQAWGGVRFPPLPAGYTVWSPFPADTSYFDPSSDSVMINFVVDDLDAVLDHAAEEGSPALARDDSDPNGRFAWLLDPDGRKIELWEPPRA